MENKVENIAQSLRLFAVLGNPIKHSLSPRIHNFAINKLSLQAFYSRFCLPNTLQSNDLREFLLSSDLSGVNVTVPFKERAFDAVHEIVGIAKDIGALNTIIKQDSRLIGYNTDADGFYLSIQQYNPKRVLLLGAGGSARSIALILAKKNIMFSVANRSEEKLCFFKQFAQTFSFEELMRQNVFHYDIVVNATSASIAQELPIKKECLEKIFANCQIAFDLMYQEDLTPFCKLAKQFDMKVFDGKNMLVYQGALAFLYFHNLAITNENFFYIADLMAQALAIRL